MGLSTEQANVGKRIREVRRAHRVSQRLAAAMMCISREQLNRIERGEVAVRLLPALYFCQAWGINPLWLALGDAQGPSRFFWLDYDTVHPRGYRPLVNILRDEASQIPVDAIFLDEMQRRKKDYRAVALQQMINDQIPWSIESEIVWDNVRRQLTKTQGLGKIGSMKLQNASFWPALRNRIRKLVGQRGMKSALARDIGVSRQAINSMLSKTRPYAPSAEYALRLSKWVEIAEAQQKQNAPEVTPTQPARKTRRKSNYKNDKATDRKKN